MSPATAAAAPVVQTIARAFWLKSIADSVASALEDRFARMLPQLQACVSGHFPISIEHSTFQIETQLNAAQKHVAHG